MRLISCHIENFGKLSDYTVEFEKKQNIICQENGWGKSTFAAFIRAMFYGLEGERKRNLEENERKRYKPWQGGVFGGKLTFEVNEKRYVITRIFGEKEQNDEFELRDADTNLISTDYTCNIGEEIFKINRASFVRTVFIGQNEVETSSTDDINAKIGNLSDSANDLKCYEYANAKLTELINGLTPRRVTGSLAKRANEITSLERKVQSGSSIADTINTYQGYLQSESENYEKKKIERSEAEKLQAELSKLERIYERVSLYTLSETEKQELEKSALVFAQGIPEEAEFEKYMKDAKKLIELRQEFAAEQMSREEEARLSYLGRLFASDTESITNVIGKWNNRNTKMATLPSNKAMLATLQAQEENRQRENKKFPVLSILGILLVFVGLFLMYRLLVPMGLIGVVAGIVMVVVGLVKKKHRAESHVAPQIRMLEETIVRDEAYVQKVDEEIKMYLTLHEKEFNEYLVATALQEIANEYVEYNSLKKKSFNIRNSNKASEIERIEEGIGSFLKQYEVFSSANQFTEELHSLKNKVLRYAVLQEKQEKYNETKTLIPHIQNEKLPSLDELNQKLQSLSEDLDSTRKRMQDYNRTLEQLQEQYEEWEENKIKLEETVAIQEEERQKYNHVLKAKEYLGLAKESMTSKYARPIFESFSKYYEMITKGTTERYHIDANTAITVEEHGKQREVNALSAGYKDLIGLSLRVALVDAMYQEETPMLIMDDPFVNLDDEKVGAAKEFLQQISEKYQVIYFTCSNARG